MRYESRKVLQQGFTLPVVVLASVVMLMVLASVGAFVSAGVSSINGQYYEDLAADAAEAGLVRAQACLDSGTEPDLWSGGISLSSNDDCDGSPVACNDSSCALVNQEHLRTTYKVTARESSGSIQLVSEGVVELLRTSNDAVWRRYNTTLKTSTSTAAGLNNIIDMAAEYYHTCALSNGKVYCWGLGDNGRLGDKTNNSRDTPVAVDTSGVLKNKTVTKISVGYQVSCALADGKAYCWGSGTTGELGNGGAADSNVPVAVSTAGVLNGKTITDITVGNYHACVIADGLPYCWGNGSSGRLGNGANSTSTVPVAVVTSGALSGKRVSQISAGANHTCVLADGQTYCWGDGASGRLGNGGTASSSVPVAVNTSGVMSGKTVTQISSDYYHTCALAEGKVYCWGAGAYGRLGNNSTANSAIPVAVVTSGALSGKTVSSIEAGYYHSCAIADGAMYCWGSNGNGRYAASVSGSEVPVEVTASGPLAGKHISTMTSGYRHSCIVADLQAYCTGLGSSGELGNGSTDSKSSYTEISQGQMEPGFDANYNTVFGMGQQYSCAIGADQWAYCWGLNDNGRLGDGTSNNSSVPVPIAHGEIPANATIRSMALGNHWACAVASDNKAYCWGENTDGQLGDGTTVDRQQPVAVTKGDMPSDKSIISLSMGSRSSCALANDGWAYCWGYNGSGRLGSGGGAASSTNTPRKVSQGQIPNGRSLLSLNTGLDYSCAIASDFWVYCWGYGGNGKLAKGNTSNSTTPTAIQDGSMPSGTLITETALGSSHGCALTNKGSVYCWGLNDNGQLGNNTTNGSNTPVAVSKGDMPSTDNIRYIATGYAISCAISSSQIPYCWGENGGGALGVGDNTDKRTPKALSLGDRPADSKTVEIAAGSSSSCLIATNARAYCMGYGANGAIGDGSNNNSNVPTLVKNYRATTTRNLLGGGVVY